jgi:integrase
METYLARATMAGRRPGTLRSWRTILTVFGRAVAPRTLLEVTRGDIEAWISRPELAAASRRAYRSCLVGFYAWAIDEGLVAVDPTARIARVRVKVGTPRPITDADLHRALEAAPARMRAWMLLMALAGLRSMEVASLHPEDLLVTDDGVLLYLRDVKGGGTATVPAHPLIVTVLTALPTRNGLWWETSAQHLSVLVNAHLRSLGIASTAHSLRHYAATSWYRSSGNDLLATQALLRHASVSSTQIYAQLDPRRSAAVVRSMDFEVA